jgi:hypothetical protein
MRVSRQLGAEWPNFLLACATAVGSRAGMLSRLSNALSARYRRSLRQCRAVGFGPAWSYVARFIRGGMSHESMR